MSHEVAILNFRGTLELYTWQDIGQIERALKALCLFRVLPYKSTKESQILWILNLFFPLTITPIKISVLSYCRLIFSTPRFKKATYVITALCVAWFIAGFPVIIFECTPYYAVYNLTVQAITGYCFPFGNFVLTYELLNSLLDISILVLPVSMIRKLQLPLKRKIKVSAVFLLGRL